MLTAAAQCNADFPGGGGEWREVKVRVRLMSWPFKAQKQEIPRIWPGEKERTCHEYLSTYVWVCVCVQIHRMTLCPRETLYRCLPWPGAPVHVTLHIQRELYSPHLFIPRGVLYDAVATSPMCLFRFKVTNIN